MSAALRKITILDKHYNFNYFFQQAKYPQIVKVNPVVKALQRNVVKAVYFPLYDGNTHDIALVKLDKPVKFSDTIRPVCLPKRGESDPVNKKCIIAGWGYAMLFLQT